MPRSGSFTLKIMSESQGLECAGSQSKVPVLSLELSHESRSSDPSKLKRARSLNLRHSLVDFQTEACLVRFRSLFLRLLLILLYDTVSRSSAEMYVECMFWAHQSLGTRRAPLAPVRKTTTASIVDEKVDEPPCREPGSN
ncbi:hypothetical protein AVEN_66981-1 [Araneus ventricosus]|uniref:Uncharacterized protein n=1 Tax=Araneus ventricosus TaxID=182803 RepID=A0A4Y2UGK0_ARAVE|nr:hypothetical protein AVEN_66981-1 [Araneus ventricosus]